MVYYYDTMIQYYEIRTCNILFSVYFSLLSENW